MTWYKICTLQFCQKEISSCVGSHPVITRKIFLYYFLCARRNKCIQLQYSKDENIIGTFQREYISFLFIFHSVYIVMQASYFIPHIRSYVLQNNSFETFINLIFNNYGIRFCGTILQMSRIMFKF